MILLINFFIILIIGISIVIIQFRNLYAKKEKKDEEVNHFKSFEYAFNGFFSEYQVPRLEKYLSGVTKVNLKPLETFVVDKYFNGCCFVLFGDYNSNTRCIFVYDDKEYRAIDIVKNSNYDLLIKMSYTSEELSRMIMDKKCSSFEKGIKDKEDEMRKEELIKCFEDVMLPNAYYES